MYVKAIKMKELSIYLAFIFGGMCLEWNNELLRSPTSGVGNTFMHILLQLHMLQFGRVLLQTTI